MFRGTESIRKISSSELNLKNQQSLTKIEEKEKPDQNQKPAQGFMKIISKPEKKLNPEDVKV